MTRTHTPSSSSSSSDDDINGIFAALPRGKAALETHEDSMSSGSESDAQGPARLSRLLSATTDKSSRLLHSEGAQSRDSAGEVSISDASGAIRLNDLIDSLSKDDDQSSDEDDSHNHLHEALSREDIKKQLKHLADEKSMYHAMNDTQMRNLEKEETENLMHQELNKWNSILDEYNDSRHKPLLYADAEKRSQSTHSQLAFKDSFDHKIHQKRAQTDHSAHTDNTENLTSLVEDLSKPQMIERAKQIAHKKRLMAIRNAKLARLKKIKSKEYRRRLRRRKAKEEEKNQALLASDPHQQLDEDEIKQQLQEERRQLIRERITLRHKAQTQWSKRAQRYAHTNSSTLNALTQKHQLANELRKKQMSIRDEHEEEDFNNLQNPETREKAVNNLLEIESDEEADAPQKGLLNMKFMKQARQKKKEETMRMLQEMDEEEGMYSSEEDEDSNTGAPQKPSYGKQSFTPAVRDTDSDDSDSEDSESEEEKKSSRSIQLQATSFSVKPKTVAKLKEAVKEDSSSDDEEESDSGSSSENEADDSDSSSSESESESDALAKQQDIPLFLLQRMNRKRKRQPSSAGVKLSRALESDDESSSDEEEGAANPWLGQYRNNLGEKKRHHKKSRTNASLVKADESDSASSASDDSSENADIAFQQDVKKAAFAGDNVQLEFEKEKEKAIDSNLVLPDLQSATLPGWGGEFIGEGTSWREEHENKQKKISEIETELRQEKVKERVDTNMDHVLIRDTARVSDEYLLETHRHSRSEREQKIYAQLHDRAHSVPLGQEWNSTHGFSSAIEPRIKLVPGRKIDAISFEKAQLMARVTSARHGTKSFGKREKRKPVRAGAR